MKQLTQQLGSGEMRVQEVPPPVVGDAEVLVRNHYSLISAGTEGSTVRAARKGLIGKARERPQQVRQVIETLKSAGPTQTYRAVRKRLDAYSPLGYSSAGEVVAVGPSASGFQIGDRVACGGGTASHAEFVTVPTNLCVRLPDDADLRDAAYNTLGAIALQGVRQARLQLGEVCVVVGLGLLGQLTGRLLRAGGVRVFGIDIDRDAVTQAREGSVDEAWVRDDPGLVDEILRRTEALGADAVILTAATSSLDPINLAGELARKKGRVVVVGDVPTGFDREPHYYRKELELRMSCSYGPGRYDPAYEEKGLDYPPAYVRWTENRNMQAFQNLVHSGRVDVAALTTHQFPIERAGEAFDLVLESGEPSLGVILEYPEGASLTPQQVAVGSGASRSPAGDELGVAFVGAGSYAQGSLLPNLPRDSRLRRVAVLTRSGTTSKRVAEKFDFELCTADEGDIFASDAVDAVFVATRHDSHAAYVVQALETGKSVFVEKPLALDEEELTAITEALAAAPSSPLLMVGFNRRFSPLANALKSRLGAGPLAMAYRVNAGSMPADSWQQDREIGGGRIIGEACHFIDLMTFLCGAPATSVHSVALADPEGLCDTAVLTLEFGDGSIGTVSYFANGTKSSSKERLEVFQDGSIATLTDFRRLEIRGGAKPYRKKLLQPDKGQAAMVRAFLDSLSNGTESPIPIAELLATSRATFAAVESLRTRQPIGLQPD